MTEALARLRRLSGAPAWVEVHMNRIDQAGAMRLKTLIWLAILGSLIYAVVKTAPHFINDFELRDAMKAEARFAAVQHKPENDIREEIFKKTTELGIPVKREAIKIRMGSNYVIIDVNYSVDIQLPGFLWKKDFSNTADSRTW